MNSALISFGIYMVFVFLLAWIAGRKSLKSESFVSEYFLGGRALGLWAFALTFATTNASGGSFMGFPARIYTHGWVLALWIAGYMTVPFIAIGILGKRINQVARKSGSITLPEVLGKQLKSDAVTLVATGVIILFMFFYLLAQFKAGGMILITLLGEEPLFKEGTLMMARFTPDWLDPEYLLTLIIFSIGVIGYVVYGGFRAVVWTDVMQGVIMFIGVAIMLILALNQVGGLSKATKKLNEMSPPKKGKVIFEQKSETSDEDIYIKKGGFYVTNNNENIITPLSSLTIKKTSIKPTEIDAIKYCEEVANLGAGEILLTSMDRDGTKMGFDNDLLSNVTSTVDIPVIASGGVGTLEHFVDGVIVGGANALLAASIFHFGEYSINDVKRYLAEQNIAVRI